MGTALLAARSCSALLLAIGTALPATAATPAVQREGTSWTIDARAMPRDTLARQLALASGSTLHGGLGGTLALVTLRWRGASLSDAWDQVLGGSVSHARRCSAARCEVWLAGPVVGVGSSGAGAVARLAQVSAPPVDPPGLFPSE